MRKMRLISSEDLFFREHHDFRTKFGLCPRISDNLLENQDLGKCHKIRAKLYCPPNFLSWYEYAIGHKVATTIKRSYE